MAISGNWVLHYSWGCTSTYSSIAVTFNGDGTFSGGIAGKWHQREGTILLGFNSGPAVYGGTVNGNVGSGSMSTFTGSEGCWYLTRQGITGVAADSQEAEQPLDVAGNESEENAAAQSGAYDAAGNPR